MSGPCTPKLLLTLTPSHGPWTELTLSGPIYRVPPTTELRRLFHLLWLWHGHLVDVALSVDGTNACWAELWEHRLASVPARHQRVRVVTRGDVLGRDADRDG